MASTQHFSVIDNSALESSMGSTQGLLSFITNATRQIKTYLGPEQQKKNVQKKNQHQQQLLLQLTKLKTQNYNFIPNILSTSPTSSRAYEQCTIPASPTPSLDSVGSHDDIDDTPTFQTSCLMKSRRRKRMREPGQVITTSQCDSPITNKRARIQQQSRRTSSCVYSSNSATLSFPCGSSDDLVLSPSPDFEDLVDCMLTEDALANIDINNYFAPL